MPSIPDAAEMRPFVHRPRPQGFVLLEVILALALFTTVATAMAVALNQLATSTTSARRESMLLRRLQSELAEVAYLPRLELGRSESPPDADGISVEIEIERLKAINQEERSLDGLRRIRVRAAMPTGGEVLVREMETWVIRFDEIQPAAPVPAGPQPATGGGGGR